MKLLKFELTFPGINTWNGHWSGENDYYARVVRVTKKFPYNTKDIEGCYYYSFGDGWAANINVEFIDSKEAQKTRKASRGFMTYDWMIKSILQKRRIEPIESEEEFDE